MFPDPRATDIYNVGDIVSVESPAGQMEYKVLTIQRNV